MNLTKVDGILHFNNFWHFDQILNLDFLQFFDKKFYHIPNYDFENIFLYENC